MKSEISKKKCEIYRSGTSVMFVTIQTSGTSSWWAVASEASWMVRLSKNLRLSESERCPLMSILSTLILSEYSANVTNFMAKSGPSAVRESKST